MVNTGQKDDLHQKLDSMARTESISFFRNSNKWISHFPIFINIIKFWKKKKKNFDQNYASAGNRTRVNCLEGSYANHYTTDALHTWIVQMLLDKKNLKTIGF